MTRDIVSIRNDLELSIDFLRECFEYLYSCLVAEEKLYRKKYVTSVGVSKFHFDDFLRDRFILAQERVDRYDEVIRRWVVGNEASPYGGTIFRYRDQLKTVIGKYLYLMNSKGI